MRVSVSWQLPEEVHGSSSCSAQNCGQWERSQKTPDGWVIACCVFSSPNEYWTWHTLGCLRSFPWNGRRPSGILPLFIAVENVCQQSASICSCCFHYSGDTYFWEPFCGWFVGLSGILSAFLWLHGKSQPNRITIDVCAISNQLNGNDRMLWQEKCNKKRQASRLVNRLDFCIRSYLWFVLTVVVLLSRGRRVLSSLS